MELSSDAVAIMTPVEMRMVRKKLAGMTLDALSERVKVSKTQLSQYECGRNGLTPRQVQACRDVLFEIARERSQALSILLSRDMEGEESMAAAS